MNIFKEIYKYRELLKTSVQKDIRGRYKNSFLGVIWSFFNPLLQLLVYALIFPLVLVNTPDNYVIFICVALIPWTYFTTTVSQSSYTVIGNGNIVKKVYFPREILPISVVTSGAVNFIISSIIIIAFLVIYGIGISKYIIFYPIILLVQYILLLGISFIISSITVYFRDLEHIVGIILMAAFYATPIFYSEESIPIAFKNIINLNPMAHIIYAYRNIFYYQKMPDFYGLGTVALVSLALLVIGYFVFHKLQKGFAEEL